MTSNTVPSVPTGGCAGSAPSAGPLPMNPANRFVSTGVTVDDTSQETDEKELRQSKEAAEAANRAKDDFPTPMSATRFARR